MNRLTFLIAAALLLSPLAALRAADASKPATPPRPNILLILTDDQRADCIGAMGNPHIHTPNMDRLVREGLAFSNCYIMGSTEPAVCTPSRTMLMSGRTLFHLPSDIKEKNNHPEVPVMPTVLRAAGYDTFRYGKDGNVYKPATRAFDETFFYKSSKEGWTWRQSQDYADKAIAYLRDPVRGKPPFFLCLEPSVPHDPIIPKPEDLALYTGDNLPPLPPNAAISHAALWGFSLHDTNVRTYDVPGVGRLKTPLNLQQMRVVLAHYYGLITTFDTQLGRILDELDRSGAAKNTIVIFASDNGLSHSHEGLIHKQSIYDQDNRVPLIIRGPGIPAGVKSDTYVYLSDLFPTMCEWVGAPIPATVETKSMNPTIADPARPHRTTLYAAYRNECRSFRAGQYKLILYSSHHTQLFDTKADPYEMHNLADDPAQTERVIEMIAEARQAGKELGENQNKSPFWKAWNSPAAPAVAKPEKSDGKSARS